MRVLSAITIFIVICSDTRPPISDGIYSQAQAQAQYNNILKTICFLLHTNITVSQCHCVLGACGERARVTPILCTLVWKSSDEHITTLIRLIAVLHADAVCLLPVNFFVCICLDSHSVFRIWSERVPDICDNMFLAFTCGLSSRPLGSSGRKSECACCGSFFEATPIRV